MENKLPGSHRFFKVMTPEFKSKLPLPEAFCRKLDGQLSEVAIITTCKGIWRVNVEKSCGDLVSFSGGWDIFAREHNLSLGNFIVFKHIGRMHFTATIFDLTACEKDFSVNITNKKHGMIHGRIGGLERKHSKTRENRRKTSTSGHKGRSHFTHFTAVIKPHSVDHPFTCKYLPKAFWKAHGLDKKKSIILRDCRGDEWPIKVMVCNAQRVVMGKGWSKFSNSNNLKVGDVCSFSLRKVSDKCDSVLMDVSISRRDSVSMDVSISRLRKED